MGKREQPKNSHIEFSKICVSTAFLLSIGFIIYVCIEMHIQENLEPVAYIGAGILVCLAIIVRAYMKRAYQKDLAQIEIDKAKQLTALKKESGDDFVHDKIDDVSVDN